MATKAYTLKSTLDGWIAGDTNEQIRNRAAAAYDKHQECGFRGAHQLLTRGWSFERCRIRSSTFPSVR